MSVQINIDVTDWADEYQREEPNLSTEEMAFVAAMRAGYKPQQMGRLLAIARHREESEFAPPPKPMLNMGYAFDWTQRLVRQKDTATLPSGKEIEVNRFVNEVLEHPQNDGDDGQEFDAEVTAPEVKGIVQWDDPAALDRAIKYLLERVPGYIYGRLKIIAANGGDVQGVANMLCDKIQEMVQRLV